MRTEYCAAMFQKQTNLIQFGLNYSSPLQLTKTAKVLFTKKKKKKTAKVFKVNILVDNHNRSTKTYRKQNIKLKESQEAN